MPSKPLLNRFEPGAYFHVFNRGNNKETTFFDEHCYVFYLERYQEYLSGYVDTLAFSLMPNHFHFLIRIKEDSAIKNGKIISNQFRKLALAYTLHINKMRGRIGSIFARGLRKKKVIHQKYLQYLIFYIHRNPAKHGIVRDYTKYHFSSYNIFLNGSKSVVDRDLTLSLFNNNVNDFISFHQSLHNENRIIEYLME
jgi:REP element-mobilizing transposase RayT